ncbi:hypothetical protein BGX38DRAFT_530982 [Terfezia claveryi]|nr:hypothetical protein BGX38DRAFT_530982 [Terfezia claveryi]
MTPSVSHEPFGRPPRIAGVSCDLPFTGLPLELGYKSLLHGGHYLFFYCFNYLYTNNPLAVGCDSTYHRINIIPPIYRCSATISHRLRHFSSLHYIGFTAMPLFTIRSSIITAIYGRSASFYTFLLGVRTFGFSSTTSHLNMLTWFSYFRCLALELCFFH